MLPSQRMAILYSPSINLSIIGNGSARDIPFRYHENGAAMNAFYGCSIAKGRLDLLVRYWVPAIDARHKPQDLEVVSCHEGTPASTSLSCFVRFSQNQSMSRLSSSRQK